MQIRAYGLFWDRDGVDWEPGAGRSWDMLGRSGANRNTIRVTDFRHQQGLYILYGNYGPYYVGLTRKQGLGKRLKDHITDDHADQWERFSWFGFCRPLKRTDARGIAGVSKLAETGAGRPSDAIADTEALLIKALGLPSNIRSMSFKRADEWEQVSWYDRDKWLARVDPGNR